MADHNIFTMEEHGGVAVVNLRGKLDRDSITMIDDTIEELKSRKLHRVVFDFENVEYIFSAALGKLILFLKSSRNEGGDIHVTGLNRSIAAIFEVTRLREILPVHSTVAEAVAAFAVPTEPKADI
ncbi:MAG: hypothetical protein CVV64_01470 [Candidatus Wallbacteria bacterium HGW-Wallbacteria-1]|jgi:anti-sigma B factor antagonist|uniref:Anti-sigma factor antagonist n=1 Tax=Candidatus Wallbacteria bacterium HGW-Wallbacteria-1 TaxID=2013854 RepID=A0A2N1PUV6_9BACT|nr:MAG: hypothetical protein CVV64_01470 [Candidatus Wallbacteria bacterium HGW-Wallbacteria-1]